MVMPLHSRASVIPRTGEKLYFSRCGSLFVRHASTSTYAGRVPPESPKFIDVPRPPQQQAKFVREVKGVLPVPRQLFPPDTIDKTSAEYLATVIPERTNKREKKLPSSPDIRELVLWKSRQTETRRRNLREGLEELKQRKLTNDRQRAARTAYKQAEQHRRVNAPERDDERLTKPSIIRALTQSSGGIYSDPVLDAKIVQQKKKRVMAKDNAKLRERRYALHSLYMNARNFIVTEEELNNTVDRVFDDEWFQVNPTRSIWDKDGFPDTVGDILSTVNKTSSRAVQYNEGSGAIIKDRVQRIAEELTGGKM